jgi:hypothetical protein
MYPLIPWKWLTGILTLVVAASVYANEVGALVGVPMPDQSVVRYLPLGLLSLIGAFFGPTAWWAPWRFLWRFLPFLNKRVFPDINGIWVGSTKSNWSKIERMVEASLSRHAVSRAEIEALPLREDALAVEITASLFVLRIRAALSSTEGQSFSLSAKPRKDALSGKVHVTYVYSQDVPTPALFDQDSHMGAADVAIDLDDIQKAEGVYWTRRMWMAGLNTAGRIELKKLSIRAKKQKTLRQYASEARSALTDVPK